MQQRSQVEQVVERALGRRRALGFRKEEGFRVLDGVGDGLPGISIDSYGGNWVVGTQDVEMPPEIGRFAGRSEWCDSVWWKRLDVDEKGPPEQVAGGKISGAIWMVEGGWEFEIQLGSGYSQGIFLDQRENRKEVNRRAAEGGEAVLNLFAYTCGFSVAAAMGGVGTVSVDLSRNYLEWGKRNFERNGIAMAGHAFMRDDSFDVLRRFAKRGRKFSGVVLDPPTFSRNDGGKVFRVERDFGRLVAAAAEVLVPGGWMLCSSNTRKVGRRAFRAMVEEGIGAGKTRRRAGMVEGKMPPDFTGDDYLKSLWVEVL